MPKSQASSDYAAWRDRLATANDPAFWPIEAIDKELIEGRAQFWSDGASALVTRVVAYPGGAKVLEAIAAAGAAGSLTGPITRQCEAFAQTQGLTRMEAKGRLGWQRRLPEGWRAHQVIIVRDLADGQ